MSYFCVAKSESCFLGPHASTETSSMNSFIRHDQPARVVSVIVRLGIAIDTPYWRYQTSTSIIQAIDGNSSRSSRHCVTGMIPRKRSWSSASAGGSSILVKASMSQAGVCLLALAPAGRFSSKRCKNLRCSPASSPGWEMPRQRGRQPLRTKKPCSRRIRERKE